MSTVGLNHDTRVRSADRVMFRELEGEAVLLDLESGVYYGLNDTGTRVWSLLREATRLGDVHRRLLNEFDVAPELLWQDLLNLIGEMKERKLVEVFASD